MGNEKLVFVCSNSLAYEVKENPKTGELYLEKKPGGLGVGVEEAVKKGEKYRMAHWIGIAAMPKKDGNPDQDKKDKIQDLLAGVNCSYLFLDKDLRDSFYKNGVNGELWSEVHNMRNKISENASLKDYQEVNHLMAEALLLKIKETCKDEGTELKDVLLWAQDSHVASVGSFVKENEPNIKVGYFHHTPFQNKDKIGEGESSEIKESDQKEMYQIIEDLLKVDSIVFHTQRDVDNFKATVETFNFANNGPSLDSKLKVQPIGIPKELVENQFKNQLDILRNPNKEVDSESEEGKRITKFKADLKIFNEDVVSWSVLEESKLQGVVDRLEKGNGSLHDLETMRYAVVGVNASDERTKRDFENRLSNGGLYFDPDKINIGSVQRSDYTKGVHEQLNAFEDMLDIDSTLVGKVQLNMVCSAARDIPAFAEYEKKSFELVDRINEKFPRSVRYAVGVQNPSLPAFNAANDIVTATSIQDGYILAIGEAIHARTLALQMDDVIPDVNRPSAAIVSNEAGIAVDLGGIERKSNNETLSLVNPNATDIQKALISQVNNLIEARENSEQKKKNTDEFLKISGKMTNINTFGPSCLDHLSDSSISSEIQQNGSSLFALAAPSNVDKKMAEGRKYKNGVLEKKKEAIKNKPKGCSIM